MTVNQIAYLNYLESRRSNMANEELKSRAQTESERANRASESEHYRHNVATEGQALAELNELNRHNLVGEAIQSETLAETIRSNKAKEFETLRSNQARENETHMHNVVLERNDTMRAESERFKNEAQTNLLYKQADTEKNRANLIAAQERYERAQTTEAEARLPYADTRAWNEADLSKTKALDAGYRTFEHILGFDFAPDFLKSLF